MSVSVLLREISCNLRNLRTTFTVRRFLHLKVEGIIVAPVLNSEFASEEKIKKYKDNNIVIIDRYSQNLYLSEVTNDHYQGAVKAIEHLYEQGYRKIAHIRGLENDVIADRIFEGYQDALKSLGLKYCTHYTCGFVSPEEGSKAMHHFFEQSEMPDAVFSISDEAAQGVYRYCYERDIRIPKDLGVIGFSNASFSKYLTPSLSTIEQHSFEIGHCATEMLIANDSDKIEKKIFKSKLIKRESTLK